LLIFVDGDAANPSCSVSRRAVLVVRFAEVANGGCDASRAATLNPSLAAPLFFCALAHAALGHRDEALRWAQRGAKLDPSLRSIDEDLRDRVRALLSAP
jgi:hypothetical protein